MRTTKLSLHVHHKKLVYVARYLCTIGINLSCRVMHKFKRMALSLPQSFPIQHHVCSARAMFVSESAGGVITKGTESVERRRLGAEIGSFLAQDAVPRHQLGKKSLNFGKSSLRRAKLNAAAATLRQSSGNGVA